MIAKFIQSKKTRKFPKFWEEQWVIDTTDKFFQQTDPPYIFIKTIQKNLLMVWGEPRKTKK